MEENYTDRPSITKSGLDNKNTPTNFFRTSSFIFHKPASRDFKISESNIVDLSNFYQAEYEIQTFQQLYSLPKDQNLKKIEEYGFYLAAKLKDLLQIAKNSALAHAFITPIIICLIRKNAPTLYLAEFITQFFNSIKVFFKSDANTVDLEFVNAFTMHLPISSPEIKSENEQETQKPNNQSTVHTLASTPQQNLIEKPAEPQIKSKTLTKHRARSSETEKSKADTHLETLLADRLYVFGFVETLQTKLNYTFILGPAFYPIVEQQIIADFYKNFNSTWSHEENFLVIEAIKKQAFRHAYLYIEDIGYRVDAGYGPLVAETIKQIIRSCAETLLLQELKNEGNIASEKGFYVKLAADQETVFVPNKVLARVLRFMNKVLLDYIILEFRKKLEAQLHNLSDKKTKKQIKEEIFSNLSLRRDAIKLKNDPQLLHLLLQTFGQKINLKKIGINKKQKEDIVNLIWDKLNAEEKPTPKFFSELLQETINFLDPKVKVGVNICLLAILNQTDFFEKFIEQELVFSLLNHFESNFSKDQLRKDKNIIEKYKNFLDYLNPLKDYILKETLNTLVPHDLAAETKSEVCTIIKPYLSTQNNGKTEIGSAPLLSSAETETELAKKIQDLINNLPGNDLNALLDIISQQLPELIADFRDHQVGLKMQKFLKDPNLIALVTELSNIAMLHAAPHDMYRIFRALIHQDLTLLDRLDNGKLKNALKNFLDNDNFRYKDLAPESKILTLLLCFTKFGEHFIPKSVMLGPIKEGIEKQYQEEKEREYQELPLLKDQILHKLNQLIKISPEVLASEINKFSRLAESIHLSKYSSLDEPIRTEVKKLFNYIWKIDSNLVKELEKLNVPLAVAQKIKTTFSDAPLNNAYDQSSEKWSDFFKKLNGLVDTKDFKKTFFEYWKQESFKDCFEAVLENPKLYASCYSILGLVAFEIRHTELTEEEISQLSQNIYDSLIQILELPADECANLFENEKTDLNNVDFTYINDGLLSKDDNQSPNSLHEEKSGNLTSKTSGKDEKDEEEILENPSNNSFKNPPLNPLQSTSYILITPAYDSTKNLSDNIRDLPSNPGLFEGPASYIEVEQLFLIGLMFDSTKKSHLDTNKNFNGSGALKKSYTNLIDGLLPGFKEFSKSSTSRSRVNSSTVIDKQNEKTTLLSSSAQQNPHKSNLFLAVVLSLFYTIDANDREKLENVIEYYLSYSGKFGELLNIEASECKGHTVLTFVAEQNRIEILTLLLDKDLDFNDPNIKTAILKLLKYAVNYNRRDLMRTIVPTLNKKCPSLLWQKQSFLNNKDLLTFTLESKRWAIFDVVLGAYMNASNDVGMLEKTSTITQLLKNIKNDPKLYAADAALLKVPLLQKVLHKYFKLETVITDVYPWIKIPVTTVALEMTVTDEANDSESNNLEKTINTITKKINALIILFNNKERNTKKINSQINKLLKEYSHKYIIITLKNLLTETLEKDEAPTENFQREPRLSSTPPNISSQDAILVDLILSLKNFDMKTNRVTNTAEQAQSNNSSSTLDIRDLFPNLIGLFSMAPSEVWDSSQKIRLKTQLGINPDVELMLESVYQEAAYDPNQTTVAKPVNFNN